MLESAWAVRDETYPKTWLPIIGVAGDHFIVLGQGKARLRRIEGTELRWNEEKDYDSLVADQM